VKKQITAGIMAGAFLLGTAGAALVVPGIAEAADPTPSPTATTTTTPTAPSGVTGTAPTTGTTPTTGTAPAGDRAGHGGPGGLDADDLTAAAGALGMTEADLTTALQGGQTVAAVATTKGVDLQKVIDAIVASDKAEIAAAVTAGTMTQAQADQRLANLAQHVTDEVNGVASGPGGRAPDQTTTSQDSSTSTTTNG
jgi:hypothetical protein